jgi:hypothetical protein
MDEAVVDQVEAPPPVAPPVVKPVVVAAKPVEKALRVALLWQTERLGLYSNLPFDDLYKGVGHNNGNLAFVYAIASHLANPTKFFPWHASPEALQKSADIIVIPCANQLGKHTDLGVMADKLEKTGLPVVAIGLGAQADSYEHDIELSDGTLRWAQVLAKLAVSPSPNMYTRGAFTKGQLDKLGIGSAVAGGCPSYFTNQSPLLGQKIAANWPKDQLPRGISVAGGHQAWVKTREIEHQLISMMMDPAAPGQYVVQSMGDMIKMSRCDFDTIEPSVLQRIHAHTVPHYSVDEFKAWCRNYARSFYDVPSWMDTLRRHDLTVGSRYHGVALALQAERMGLTITIDSRTTELCENTGVPHMAVQDIDFPMTRANLKKKIVFDPKTYDLHRSKSAASYIEFLTSNKIKPAPFLAKIAANK